MLVCRLDMMSVYISVELCAYSQSGTVESSIKHFITIVR
jgi:hypothetical protein